METDTNPPTGVEARVCHDIAARQQIGLTKYGVAVEQSPDDMLWHAYEEAMDLAVYLRAEWERRSAALAAIELIDGAYELVEIWPAESPAQKAWKSAWLSKARALGANPEW